jgi:ABC-type sugar transport system ATPase subunit
MARQFVYFMQGLTKSYPTRKVLDNVHLSFYPDAKIGVLGVNGSGKSTLLRIMAGLDKEYNGEAWVAEGARVGYLEQEPQLDATKTVRENVMLGVAKQKAILDRYNELAMNYSEETADEMTKLQDEIEAAGLWDLDSKVDQATDALPMAGEQFHGIGVGGGDQVHRQEARTKCGVKQAQNLVCDQRISRVTGIVSVQRIESAQIIGGQKLRSDQSAVSPNAREQAIQIVDEGPVLLCDRYDLCVDILDALLDLRYSRG